MDESELNAQGLHDDRKREVAEWRRLVEEAQQRSATWQHNHEDALRAGEEARADAKRNALSNIELRIEVGRLKIELAEARRLIESDRAVSCQCICGPEWRNPSCDLHGDARRECLAQTNSDMKTPREWVSFHETSDEKEVISALEARDTEWRRLVERAKVDLIEARRCLADCVSAMGIQEQRESGAFHLSSTAFYPMWLDAKDNAAAFLAAPPAEQAQPTYEDGEGRPAPLKPARLISAKPIKTAEQAQGEGAQLKWSSSTPCQTCKARFDEHFWWPVQQLYVRDQGQCNRFVPVVEAVCEASTPTAKEARGKWCAIRYAAGPPVTEEAWHESRRKEDERATHPCTDFKATRCMCKGSCGCHWVAAPPVTGDGDEVVVREIARRHFDAGYCCLTNAKVTVDEAYAAGLARGRALGARDERAAIAAELDAHDMGALAALIARRAGRGTP